MATNAGYLKLRKIRAAQQIAKTVSDVLYSAWVDAQLQVSQSQNRVYLSSGALLLNIGDKDYYHDVESASKKSNSW